MSEQDAEKARYAELATELVSAFVGRNSVPITELPNLIRSVHDTLSTLGQPHADQPAAEPLRPAVPIKKSITDEFIISLEDGRKLKSMKRYLAGLGMTPAEYRAKWGLPHDYPMVAPAYAAQRSALAKSLGLGQIRRSWPATPEPKPEPVAAEAPAPKPKRTRKAAA